MQEGRVYGVGWIGAVTVINLILLIIITIRVLGVL